MSATAIVSNTASISLPFAAPAHSDAQQWRVQIATNPQFSPISDEQGSAASPLVLTDYPEGRYYWRVHGQDAAGNAGPPSTAGTFVIDRTAPATARLTVALATETSLLVTFPSPGDDGDRNNLDVGARYELRYAKSGNFTWATGTLVAPMAAVRPYEQPVVVTVSGLVKETEYYFRLRTIDDAANTSADSSEVTERTPDLTAPGAVTDLTATRSSGKVTLRWTMKGDDGSLPGLASKQIVYLRDGAGSISTTADLPLAQTVGGPAAGTPGTATLHEITSLKPNTTYTFAVLTLDEAGNLSALSNVVSLNYSALTALRPQQAAPGDVVELDGVNLGTSVGDVYFGGLRATRVLEWGNDLVRVEVPEGAASGAVLTSLPAGLSESLLLSVAPAVYNLYPREGLLGRSMFFSGSGFGTNVADNRIGFGRAKSILATDSAVTEWNDDAITFFSGSTDAPGLYPLRVERGTAMSLSTTHRAWRMVDLSQAATARTPRALAAGFATNDLHLLTDTGSEAYHRVADLDATTPAFGAETALVTGASPAGGQIRDVDMSLDEDGNAYFCFTYQSGSNIHVFYRRRTAAGAWGTPIDVGATVADATLALRRENCSIAAAKNLSTLLTGVIIVWTEGEYGTRPSHRASSSAGPRSAGVTRRRPTSSPRARTSATPASRPQPAASPTSSITSRERPTPTSAPSPRASRPAPSPSARRRSPPGPRTSTAPAPAARAARIAWRSWRGPTGPPARSTSPMAPPTR